MTEQEAVTFAALQRENEQLKQQVSELREQVSELRTENQRLQAESAELISANAVAAVLEAEKSSAQKTALTKKLRNVLENIAEIMADVHTPQKSGKTRS